MNKIIVAITSDHAGIELKNNLIDCLKNYASETIDLGAYEKNVSVDYPDYGDLLAQTILAGKAQYGVAICGSGIGISIAANRHKGIRAALCHDGLTASLARQHNNANVLCLGARIIGIETAIDCINNFFTSDFLGDRHQKRVDKLG